MRIEIFGRFAFIFFVLFEYNVIAFFWFIFLFFFFGVIVLCSKR
jgi:hypothetical protein